MWGVVLVLGAIGCAGAPPPAVQVMPEAVVVAEPPVEGSGANESLVEVPAIEPTLPVASVPEASPGEPPVQPPEDEGPDPDVGSRDPFNSDIVDANVEGRFILERALRTPASSDAAP